ncbi:MAG TPA: ABC transporter substrate-binding protein [Candidatus Saccharimonadales bacterium]|nr:ABC transporter substrate-binding protein [Candidatus Saccharimonadales bacterium]
MPLAVGLAAVVAGCTSTPATTPTPGGSGPVADGGTLTVGVWQAPTTLLDAGIVGNLPFADVIAAPVEEGLLWYRATSATMTASTEADYWSPDLATEVPTVANGGVETAGCADTAAKMCVTWHLRQGVQWDDGSMFTSRDVCDTFDVHWLSYGAAGKPNPTPVASTAGWNQVIKCTEVDQHTAVVDFKSQYGPYLALGSGVDGILPATVLDPALAAGSNLETATTTFNLAEGSGNAAAFKGSASLGTALDGTGPFVLAGYKPGSQVVLVRNPDYWNTSGLAHLSKLVFRIEPDLATEEKDVRSGAVEVGLNLGLSALPGLNAAAKAGNAPLKVDPVPGSGAEVLMFNLCAGNGGQCANPSQHENEDTADLTVRRAILLGIDRQAIVSAIAPGATVPPDSWMSLGASYLGSDGVPTTGFNLDQANATLDSAGDDRNAKCGAAPDGQDYRAFKDGTCLVINVGTTSDDAARMTIEGLVKADLAKIGINVPMPFTPNVRAGTFFDSLADGGPLAAHAFDIALYTVGLGIPGEPDTYTSTWHGDCGGTCPSEDEIPSSADLGAGTNFSGLSDAKLDAALDVASGTADLGARAHDYGLVDQRLAALLPAIPLFAELIVNTYSTSLFGVTQNDLVPDFDTAAWYCASGNCAG